MDTARTALLITGTVGVGKTIVAAKVGEALADRHTAHAVIDLDCLRTSWPAPPDDPFNLAMELRNLTSVASNYRDAGVRHLVLSGVLERRSDLVRYEDAVGMRVTVVRLRAEPDVLTQRLSARHAIDPRGLTWHLARAGELDNILDDAHVTDHEIYIGARGPESIAADVMSVPAW
jgi:adenylylsulfate kinase